MIRITSIILIILSFGLCSFAQEGQLVKMVKEASGDPDKLQIVSRTLTAAEDSEQVDTLKQVRRAWKLLAIEYGNIRYYKPAYLAMDHYIHLKNKAHATDKDQIVTDEVDRLENLLSEATEENDVLLTRKNNLEKTYTEQKDEDSNAKLISILISLAFAFSAIAFLFISLKSAYNYKNEAAILRSQLNENLVNSVLGKMSGRVRKAINKGLDDLSNLSEWFSSKEPVLEEQLTGKTIQALKELVEKSETTAKELKDA